MCDWLRDRLLRRLKCQLYHEFISYLRHTHATLYDSFLKYGKAWLLRQCSEPLQAHQGGSELSGFSLLQVQDLLADIKAGTNVLRSYNASTFSIGNRVQH